MAGPPPRYGTWVMSMPATRFTSSMYRWLVVPVPDDPMVIFPGSFFAAATNSANFFHGRWAFTTSRMVPVETRVIGASSFSGSIGMREP